MSEKLQMMPSQKEQSDFELTISLITGITFIITFIVGIIGNTMVLLTIILHRKMRNRTNILILNLAIAELIFIMICVPSTGLNFIAE